MGVPHLSILVHILVVMSLNRYLHTKMHSVSGLYTTMVLEHNEQVVSDRYGQPTIQLALALLSQRTATEI